MFHKIIINIFIEFIFDYEIRVYECITFDFLFCSQFFLLTSGFEEENDFTKNNNSSLVS